MADERPEDYVLPTELYGKPREVKEVWVLLDQIYQRDEDAKRHLVGHGLDMVTRVPGYLQTWHQTALGDWLGMVHFDVPYADGRRMLSLRDQLVPSYALRPRPARLDHGRG